LLGLFISLVPLVGALLLLLYASGPLACEEKWKNSGYQSDYGFLSGCRVSRDGKVWIPEDVVREVK
jgi:hypothetical protein